jgi:DNA-binding response OmpR family regulator
VDGYRDAEDSLGMLLRIMGNDVRTAHDGERGVAAAEEFRPDVALFDLGPTKMDGLTACRLIARRGRAISRGLRNAICILASRPNRPRSGMSSPGSMEYHHA